MTGRNPKPELVELADYITNMNAVKHPFEKGYRQERMKCSVWRKYEIIYELVAPYDSVSLIGMCKK